MAKLSAFLGIFLFGKLYLTAFRCTPVSEPLVQGLFQQKRSIFSHHYNSTKTTTVMLLFTFKLHLPQRKLIDSSTRQNLTSCSAIDPDLYNLDMDLKARETFYAHIRIFIHIKDCICNKFSDLYFIQGEVIPKLNKAMAASGTSQGVSVQVFSSVNEIDKSLIYLFITIK